MQISLPCLLFVTGNLITSCVAKIQTGGMLRMLLMTHTQRLKRQTGKHFTSQVSTCYHHVRTYHWQQFSAYDRSCFFVS